MLKKKLFIVVILIIAAVLTACSENSPEKETMSMKPETSNALYTREYLYSVMDDIEEYMLAHQQSDDELVLAMLDVGVYEDCIIVHFEKVSDDIIKLFKEKISDSDAIKFEEGERFELL